MAFPEITEAKRIYTRDDLREISARPENELKDFELIDGEIIEMPSASPIHAWVILQIAALLKTFVDANSLGVVFPDGPDFNLLNGDTVRPDTSFVAGMTYDTIPAELDIAPDLAVEVVSPSNTPPAMKRKVEGYLRSGSTRVWVVYYESRTVDVYRLLADGSIAYKTHGVNDTLHGETLLPGLMLRVADIFVTKPQTTG